MNDVDEFLLTPTRADVAARVLAGLAASGRYFTVAEAARHAVELTDALIERLEKTPLAGEPRCQHESSPDDGARPVGEHAGVPAAYLERTNMNTTTTANDGWGQYKRKGVSEMRPWVPGFDMTQVSVSPADKENGSPKAGDMIARNPKNHADQWLVAAKYFTENLEPA
jgi:hypothetical protein